MSTDECSPSSSDNTTKDVPKEKSYTLSIYPKGRKLSKEFVDRVSKIESHLKRRVLVVIDSRESKFFHPGAHFAFRRNKDQLGSQPIAVLLESYGGMAKLAFQAASMIRRKCGGYSVIVPDVALSAATLFCLGADTIYLGDDATLGPLDAQIPDDDVEEDLVSALDTVQAVEQLEDSAIEVGWKMARFLHERTGKKYNLVLEHALHFAAEITQPLFNKIDAIRYSRQSRLLKEAQDYAERLLQPRFNQREAAAIAKGLVTHYATHDFVIDRNEAKCVGTVQETDERESKTVGLHVEEKMPAEMLGPVDWLAMQGFQSWGMGFIEEMNEQEVT